MMKMEQRKKNDDLFRLRHNVRQAGVKISSEFEVVIVGESCNR